MNSDENIFGRVPRLILHSLALEPDRAAIEPDLRSIDDGDWSAFFYCADLHGVTPLIAHQWQALGLLDRLPIETRDRLSSAYRDNTERSENIRREVIEYWNLIAAAKVPSILIKGWPLAEMLYESPALRLITDMDLLVPRDRAQDGLIALQRAGLEPLPRDRDAWIEKHLPSYWRLNGRTVTYPLQNMFDPYHPRSVELHVNLWEENFRGLRLRDLSGFWERSRVINVAGQPMRVPSLEDAFIHLCVHWACHWIERAARLNQLVDLDRFMRRYNSALAWPLILRLSDEARVTRFVFAALDVVQRVFDSPRPPAEMTAQLRAGCPPPLQQWIDRYTLNDVAQLDYRQPDKGTAYVLTNLAAQSIGEKFGIVRYALLPPREFIIMKYQLNQHWLAIPFYVPYILSRAFGLLKPFLRAVTRSARLEGRA